MEDSTIDKLLSGSLKKEKKWLPFATGLIIGVVITSIIAVSLTYEKTISGEEAATEAQRYLSAVLKNSLIQFKAEGYKKEGVLYLIPINLKGGRNTVDSTIGVTRDGKFYCPNVVPLNENTFAQLKEQSDARYADMITSAYGNKS